VTSALFQQNKSQAKITEKLSRLCVLSEDQKAGG